MEPINKKNNVIKQKKMLRRNTPVIKPVESVLKPRESL